MGELGWKVIQKEKYECSKTKKALNMAIQGFRVSLFTND